MVLAFGVLPQLLHREPAADPETAARTITDLFLRGALSRTRGSMKTSSTVPRPSPDARLRGDHRGGRCRASAAKPRTSRRSLPRGRRWSRRDSASPRARSIASSPASPTRDARFAALEALDGTLDSRRPRARGRGDARGARFARRCRREVRDRPRGGVARARHRARARGALERHRGGSAGRELRRPAGHLPQRPGRGRAARRGAALLDLALHRPRGAVPRARRLRPPRGAARGRGAADGRPGASRASCSPRTRSPGTGTSRRSTPGSGWARRWWAD